jgi:hypothetical protein
MDPELEKAFSYAQKLLDAAIDVVEPVRVEPNENWKRDPKIFGLAILCRSISNFRASVLLVQHEQVREARALGRLMQENLLWLGALRARGHAFVQEMREDEAFNRKALGRLTLEIEGKHGGDVDGPDALKLRTIIKSVGQEFSPKPNKLDAKKTAAQGDVEAAYIDYLALSLDAMHCSILALKRHLSSKRIDGKVEVIVSDFPRVMLGEALSTVLLACVALLKTVVIANELVGFSTDGAAIAALVTEFERNGWRERQRLGARRAFG